MRMTRRAPEPKNAPPVTLHRPTRTPHHFLRPSGAGSSRSPARNFSPHSAPPSRPPGRTRSRTTDFSPRDRCAVHLRGVLVGGRTSQHTPHRLPLGFPRKATPFVASGWCPLPTPEVFHAREESAPQRLPAAACGKPPSGSARHRHPWIELSPGPTRSAESEDRGTSHTRTRAEGTGAPPTEQAPPKPCPKPPAPPF